MTDKTKNILDDANGNQNIRYREKVIKAVNGIYKKTDELAIHRKAINALLNFITNKTLGENDKNALYEFSKLNSNIEDIKNVYR